MLVTTRSPSRGGLRDSHIPTTSPFLRSYQYRISGFSSGSGMLTLVLCRRIPAPGDSNRGSHMGSQRAAPWVAPAVTAHAPCKRGVGGLLPDSHSNPDAT